MQWQPIETAPHEERVLLGWWYAPPWEGHEPRWECETGMATHGWRRNGISTLSSHGMATHWMPLPAPPAASAVSGDRSAEAEPLKVR